MTEEEKIKRAKMYIDKLARGINPLDDALLPEGDCVNNLRISRCLLFVSDILGKVIEEGEKPRYRPRRSELLPYFLGAEEKSSLTPLPRAATSKDITDYLNTFIDENTTRKLKTTSIAAWLVSVDALQIIQDSQGRNRKHPTQAGRIIGITTELREGQSGEYTVIIYKKEAQQFIFDNIDALIDFNNMKK